MSRRFKKGSKFTTTPRPFNLNIRLTRREYNVLSSKAQTMGLSMSQFVRARCLGDL